MCVPEVRLEREQVGGIAPTTIDRPLRWKSFPRPMRCDRDRRAQDDGRLGIDRAQQAAPCARTAVERLHRPRLPDRHAGRETLDTLLLGRASARPQRCEAPAAGGNSAMTVRSPRISATRRSGGPACASIAAPRPSASSSGRLLAAMHSPQTLRRGKRCFSTSATDRPARASRIAAVLPAGPAPTTTTSTSRTGWCAASFIARSPSPAASIARSPVRHRHALIDVRRAGSG